MPYGMNRVPAMLFHACDFISMHHGMRGGSQPRVLRTADFGHSRKARLGALAVVTAHAYHASIILHVMSNVHAARHAVRAHVERAQDRSPSRGRPGSLPGGTNWCVFFGCECKELWLQVFDM